MAIQGSTRRSSGVLTGGNCASNAGDATTQRGTSASMFWNGTRDVADMDCAKGIAFLCENEGDISDYIYGRRKSDRALPLILLPTT